MKRKSWMVYSMLLLGAWLARGQAAAKPEPALANVKYGENERHVLDFWKAESATPTPLVVYIHGGGFRGGDKNTINAEMLRRMLGAGISVAAIHYRLLPAHPLPAAHEDAKRAIQFLRSKSKEWNIDKTRVGAFGGSAGAQLCMYLGFHNEMAKPDSPDPLERESTRLAAVVTNGGQTTMDMEWWTANIPGYRNPHRQREEIYGGAPDEKIRAIVAEISAFPLISKDDPPIYMTYGMAPGAPPPDDTKKVQNWMVHHVNFGVELKKRMEALGLEAELKYPGAQTKYASPADFFLVKLGKQK
jgi:hypothetical protein